MSNGNDNPHGDPHGDQRGDQRGDGTGNPTDGYGYRYGYGYGGEAQGSYPQDSWGGEYDADATGFVQLPAGGLPGPGAGADAWAGPLAAPGTGQGGYTPPTLDPADVAGSGSSPMTSAPTTDPGATGQWAMPFGPGGTAPGAGPGAGQGGGTGGQSYVEQHAQQTQYQQQHQQDPYQRQHQQDTYQRQQGRDPYQQSRHPQSSSGEPGIAAAMGQGAAAALAGSHEARTQRRPLGSGGGTLPDAGELAGNGASFDPSSGGGGAGAPVTNGYAEQQQPDMAGDAQFADAHARRQVHFDFAGESVPESAVPSAAPERGTDPYAAPHPSAPSQPSSEGTDGGADGGHGTEGGDYEGVVPIVRSGLPWAPSTPSAAPAHPGSHPEHSSGTDPVATTQWPVDEAAPVPGSGWGEAFAHRTSAEPETPQETSPARDVPRDGDRHTTGTTAPGGQEFNASAPDSASGEAAPGDRDGNGDGAAAEPVVEPAMEFGAEHPHVSYVLRVNGADRPVTEAWIGESLLYVLRERLGLAGAKDGCAQGECGACSVQVDGRLLASCLVPAATAAGSEIRTVEGLAVDGCPSDVQRALTESGAVQCGFCVPGLAMTVHDLLEGNHAPSELETRQAICGNLCRCSGYRGVLDAVRTVVSERAATTAMEAEERDADEAPGAGPGPGPGQGPGVEPTARIPHQAGPGAGSTHPPEGGGV